MYFHFIVLLLFLIFSKENSGVNQRSLDDDIPKINVQFNDLPKADKFTKLNIMEEKKVDVDSEDTKRELKEARSRIDQLEKKIAILEGRVPQKYPDVKFLGYKERKRILVRYYYSYFFFKYYILKCYLDCCKF